MKTGAALVAVLLGTLVLSSPIPVTAQTPDEADATLEDIVVVARRAGAPMWTITQGDATLIVVGAIDGLPRDLAWRPEALQAAAARSQRVLFPQVGRASFSDIGRLIWRSRTIFLLPDGTRVADHVTPETHARLQALMGEDEGWTRTGLLFLAADLFEDKVGFRRRGAVRVDDVVRRAAREHDVPVQSIGVIRGDEFVDMLITAPPSRHAPCLEAAVVAAEGGLASGVARGEAWRSLKVAEVVAHPLEQALAQCWPWGDPDLGPQLKEQWVAAIDGSLDQPGVTMAVAPLRLLAERGGVLDALEGRGLDIVGPEWKAAADGQSFQTGE